VLPERLNKQYGAFAALRSGKNYPKESLIANSATFFEPEGLYLPVFAD
jgi:hypothetical protein